MSDILTDKEMKRLTDLAKDIKVSLSGYSNIDMKKGILDPGRTNRLAAVEAMKEYLEIHDYKVEVA